MDFLNRIRYFSIKYLVVLMRLGRPHSRLNSLFKIVEIPGIKLVTSGLVLKHTARSDSDAVEMDMILKIIVKQVKLFHQRPSVYMEE